MQQPKFMISGGGTGGHIFPAIAIADGLKEEFPEAEFLFVGAKGRMEMDRVPELGYNIEGISISGIKRKITMANLNFPFKVLSSLWKCFQLLKSFKPDVVIGTGGFASGPLLYTASVKKLPTLIQEQNSFPGITNRILGVRVRSICVAYEGMEKYFPPRKLILTGNPIRKNILGKATERLSAHSALKLNPQRRTLLVLGGSLGARRINELIEQLFTKIQDLDVNLIWQCGKLYYEDLKAKYNDQQSEQFRLLPFISNMSDAYGAADVVISRAGAGTISELAVMGKASILIPSPNVAEDHQTKNALAMTENDAAMLFRESEEPQKLLAQLLELTQEERIRQIEKNISALAKPDATREIVEEIKKLMR